MTKQETIEATKCRAKSINGKWVYGYIQFFCGEPGTINAVIHTLNKDFTESIFVNMNTIQRYIGKDNLYENDLITIGKNPTVYCIIWDEKHLNWAYIAASDPLRRFPFTQSDFNNNIKIVGNYIDNPGLWQKSV